MFLVGFAPVAKSTRKPARFNDVLAGAPWEDLVARADRALAWIATTQEALLRIVREEPAACVNAALDALNIYGEQSEGREKIAAAVEERGEREVRERFVEMYPEK